MILNSAARVRILSGGQYTMRLRSLHRAYPSLHPSGVVHWVLSEQLNIKAVTGACKLIDGCSLAPFSVVSVGICHRNKVNSTAWLYRDGPSHKTISFTLHYFKMELRGAELVRDLEQRNGLGLDSLYTGTSNRQAFSDLIQLSNLLLYSKIKIWKKN